ncbi:hypothetical protein ACJX0J_017976, partial [Zea mays]
SSITLEILYEILCPNHVYSKTTILGLDLSSAPNKDTAAAIRDLSAIIEAAGMIFLHLLTA